MAKKLFSESESYLLENWADAVQLEKCMKDVRKKYVQVFEAVLDTVEEVYKELTCRGILLKVSNGAINVGLGKEAWHSKSDRWPSGLWLYSMALEDLTSEDADSPCAGVWLERPKGSTLDMREAACKLRETASRILAKEQADRLLSDGPYENYAQIWYPIAEPKQELLRLLREDEAQGFIKCMVAYFEELTQFIPVIDEIYQCGNRSRR